MLVARAIDQNREALDVLGTIAGDDTLFIAPKHIKEISQTVKRSPNCCIYRCNNALNGLVMQDILVYCFNKMRLFGSLSIL